MNRMFWDASSLTTLDVSNWDTGNVTDMRNMFTAAQSLTTLDLSEWDTSNVTNMRGMIDRTLSLTTLDVSGWDTSNVTDMSYMFYNANSLETLDVSSWDTGKVTNMSSMFQGASSLTTLEGVSGWDTSNVTDMNYMFYNANSLETLDVSNWDTSSVTNMHCMFENATSLTTLDVSNWDTGEVTIMQNMFNNATSLTTLDFSKWDTSKVTGVYGMFRDASSLQYINLGEKSIFFKHYTYLPDLPNIPSEKDGINYTGQWTRVENSDGYEETNPKVVYKNSTEFMKNYDGNVSKTGWYTWERANVEVTPEKPSIVDPANPETEIGTTGTGDKTNPIKPNVECFDGTFEIKNPTTEGVNYSMPKDEGDGIWSVTASAKEGYSMEEKTYYFDLNVSKCDLGEPEAPTEPYYPIDPETGKEVESGIPNYEKCGIEQVKELPKDTDYVTYTGTVENNQWVVTAKAKDGYHFKDGKTTITWEFDLADVEECPTVVEPDEVDELVYPNGEESGYPTAPKCGIWQIVDLPEDNDDYSYTQKREGNIITVTITINKENTVFSNGEKTYSYEVNVLTPENCPETIDPTKPTDLEFEGISEIPTEPECGIWQRVILPVYKDGDEIKYSQNRVGTTITVTMEIMVDGKVFASNKEKVQTYTVDVKEPAECPIPDKKVTPKEPTLDKNVACEIDYKVVIPTQEGVEYTEGKVVDGKVKVTATAKKGYVLVGQNEWEFDVKNTNVCPIPDKKVTPKEPTLDKNVACEIDYKVVIPTQEGVEYTKGKVVDGKVKVTATAKKGYVLVGQNEWELDVKNTEACAIEEITMSIEADGEAGKVKSGLLNVTFSKPVDVLTKEDFEVLAKNRSVSTIKVDKLEKISDVEYNLFISGDWENETSIVVFKEVDDNTKAVGNSYTVSDTTLLFNEVKDDSGASVVEPGEVEGNNNGENTTNGNNGSNGNSINETVEKLPSTGSDNTLLITSLLMSFVTGLAYAGRRFIK